MAAEPRGCCRAGGLLPNKEQLKLVQSEDMLTGSQPEATKAGEEPG